MLQPDQGLSYSNIEIIAGTVGALVTIIQALGLFILADIRARVGRLETLAMKANGK